MYNSKISPIPRFFTLIPETVIVQIYQILKYAMFRDIQTLKMYLKLLISSLEIGEIILDYLGGLMELRQPLKNNRLPLAGKKKKPEI